MKKTNLTTNLKRIAALLCFSLLIISPMWGEEAEWKCDATDAAKMPLDSSVSTIGNISLSTNFTSYAALYFDHNQWLQFQPTVASHVDIATNSTSGLNLTQLDLVVDWYGVDGEGKGAWYEIQFCAESTFNESAIMPNPVSLYKGDGTKELSAPAPFGAKSARIVRKGDPQYYYLLLYSVKVTAERGSTPLTPSYYHAVRPNLSSTQYECYGAYTQLFNEAVGDVVGNINDTKTWITGSCYYVQNDVYADKTGWQPSYANPSDGQGYVKLKKESDIVFCVTNCVEVSALAYGSSAYPTVITVYGSNGAQVGTPLVCAGAGALNNPSEWVYGTELDASRQYMVVVSAPNCASNVQDAALHQIRFKVSESSLAGLDRGTHTFVGGTGAANSNQIAMYNNMYFGRKGGSQQISDKGVQINSKNSFIAFKLNETSQVYFDVVATGAAVTTGTWEVKALTTAQLEGIKAQQESAGTATTYFSIDGEALCSIGMSASGGAEVETNKTIILPAGCYWFGCTQADNNVHVKNVQVIEPLPTYTVTFDANGHGVAPAAIKNIEEGSTITEPAAPVALGWGFGGWYIDASCTNKWDFATSMVTSDTTLYAKWTEGLLPVQDVQDLEGMSVNNKVSMSWHIPGIVPLDGATTPIAHHIGGATYTYNEADTTIMFSGYGEGKWDQVGMAFPMKSDYITYIEYDYSAANLAAFANVWGGVVKDASTAYWEYKDPFDTDHTKGWHHAADTLNRIYWNGTYVDNPITDEIQQLAVYFNFGDAQGGNRQEVKFRNIRYHLADSADVAEIVVVRKANQVPTLEDYEKKWDGLGLTFDFVDDDIKTLGNTYCYTVYTISEKGVVSEGKSLSFYIDEAEAYSVTYDANGGVGDVPVEIDRVKNEVFKIQDAPRLYKQGYRLVGWTYKAEDYAIGDMFTMPEEEVVFTAKWEEYIVPQVQNLRITDDKPKPDSIPVAWEVYNMINYIDAPGEITVPYWNWGGGAGADFTISGDTVNVLASMGTYDNSGVALNVNLKNVQTITFEYKATESITKDVKIWGGVCVGTAEEYKDAYWQFGDFHYADGEWHTVTAHIDRAFYEGSWLGGSLDATQVIVCANSEATVYENYPFWVRYVRYHCEGDSAEVANIVVVRKYGSKSENILDGEVVHTGLSTNFADDLSNQVGGTYYYTVYALDENGVPSKGVSIAYELEKKTNITLAYNAESGTDGSAVATQGASTITDYYLPEGPEGFILEGYYTTADCKVLVMSTSSQLSKNIKGFTDADGNWINEAATCTLYTKWRDPLDCPAPMIDVHPTSDVIEQELGQEISFGLISADADTYQWCTCDEFGNNRQPIAGAAAQQATYTFLADKVGTYYYICEVKKDECRNVALSTVVTTIVYPAGLCVKYTAGVDQNTDYTVATLTQKKEPESDVHITELNDWTCQGTTATWTDTKGAKTHSPAFTATTGSQAGEGDYVALSFNVAEGSYFTISDVYASAKNATEATIYYQYTITDEAGNKFTSAPVSSSTLGGVVDMPVSSEDLTALKFVGTISFKMYAWSSSDASFRIGKYTQICGTINTLPEMTDLAWVIEPQDGIEGGADVEIKAASTAYSDAEIEYSTSDASVATIVGKDGKYYVHYVSQGEVKIIATAPSSIYYTGTSIAKDITVVSGINIFDNGAALGGPKDHRWETPTNWTLGQVPDLSQQAIIAADAIVTADARTSVDSVAMAKSVVIRPDYSVTINPTAALIVDGTIKSGEDYDSSLSATAVKQLVIKSSEAGNGALIFDNADGDTKAKVQYYCKASGAPSAPQYQWATTPYNDVNDAQDNYSGAWIAPWDNEVTKYWGDFLRNGDPMNPFEAYCITRRSAGIFDMEGTLVSTNDPELEMSYSSSAASGRNGLNLIGNSWTAPINIGQWNLENFDNIIPTVIILNTGYDPTGEGSVSEGDGGQYISIPVEAASMMPFKVIPSMQAFQVRIDDKDQPASLTMNYRQLVVPTNSEEYSQPVDIQPMRSPARRNTRWIDKSEIVTLRMDVKGANYSDFLYLFQHPVFTDGYDRGWDGEKILGSVDAAQLYVLPATGKYAVSAQPELVGTKFGFYRGEDDTYTITFDYNGTETLYLYDANTDIYTEVKNGNTYTFSSYTYSLEKRFSLTNEAPGHSIITTVDEHKDGNVPFKYIQNDHLFIRANAHLFDGQGIRMK